MIVTNKVRAAMLMALKAHVGQIDRDGKPHFKHCERVASRVSAAYKNAYKAYHDYVVVAFLHDTLEDTALTYGEIEKDFGEEVATAVVALTHLDGEETYRQFILRVARNPIARVVKVADVQDNLGRKDAKSFHKNHLYLWALDYLQNYHE